MKTGIKKMSPIEKIEQAAREIDAEMGIANALKSQVCERAGVPLGSFTRITGKTFGDFVDDMIGDGVGAVKLDRVRSSNKIRTIQLINAAVEAAKQFGFEKVTRLEIAEIAGVSTGCVSKHLGTMTNVKRSIIRHAIKNDVIPVIAQIIATNDPQAKKVSKEQRQKVAEYIAGA